MLHDSYIKEVFLHSSLEFTISALEEILAAGEDRFARLRLNVIKIRHFFTKLKIKSTHIEMFNLILIV